MTLFRFPLLLLSCFCLAVLASEELYLKTDLGTFVTRQTETDSVGFLGLRFAEPLDASLRWKVATKYSNYSTEKTIPSSEFGFRCPQVTGFAPTSIPMSEDCLFLNIWVPKDVLDCVNANCTIKNENALPVMVFIHGGAFTMGAGSDIYVREEEFNRNGVILVSINYRLGVLGFMTHPTLLQEDSRAENFGLLDQRVAISWLIDYIEHFGGKNTAITLFGESAGGLSTLWHLVSNEGEEKLMDHIQGVVIQSAPNLDFQPCDASYEMQEDAVASLKCGKYEGSEYIACLRRAPLSAVLKVVGFGGVRKLFYHTSTDRFHPFSPCVGTTSVFNVHPRVALETGEYHNDIAVMLGTCRDEGNLFILLNFMFYWEIEAETFLNFVQHVFPDSDVASKIVDKYLGDKQSWESMNAREALSELVNDMYWQCGNQRFSEWLTLHHEHVYNYVFDHETEYGPNNLGVFHAAELVYVFASPVGGARIFADEFTDVEQILAEQMNLYWSQFAHYGSPSPEGSSSLFWPLYGKDKNTMILAPLLKVEQGYKESICGFWEELYPGGVPYLGHADEFSMEPWDSFVLNTLGFLVLRNFKTVATVLFLIAFAFAIMLYAIYVRCTTIKVKAE